MSAELPKMPTAFEVVYEFPSPFGGVHRKLDSNRWNGSTPTTSQPVYSQDQLITFAQEATRQAMERAIEAVAACRPEEPNDVWEAAYQHVCDDNVKVLRALLPQSEKRHG